jgi:hypothetical protein
MDSGRYRKLGILLLAAVIAFNVGGMLMYQKLFSRKKDVRKHIIEYVLQQAPHLRPGASLCFIDLPVLDGEIMGMIYLWYKNDTYQIKAINSNNVDYVSCAQSYDPKAEYNYDYVFVYDCRKQALKMVKNP